MLELPNNYINAIVTADGCATEIVSTEPIGDPGALYFFECGSE